MSYELRIGESLGHGVRRVCRRQIECAIGASRSGANGKSSPVHQTRKHLKKARAALRLLVRAVGRDKFKRTNAKLRDVAHRLSEMRDAEVRFQTVQQLGKSSQISKNPALEEAETLLSFELESVFAAFSDWKDEACRRLTRVRQHMGQWQIEDLTCKQIRRTVQESYKRGRKTLREALRKPTAESFHIFRRRAKELMYQLRILRPLHPTLFEQLVNELEALTEHLGAAHDLAFLEKRLRKLRLRGAEDRGAKSLHASIEGRAAELQRTATALGERFYAERPKEFARRVTEYFEEWETARADHHPHSEAAARPALALNGQ